MKVARLTLLLALSAFGDFSNPPLLSYATYLGGARGSGAQGLAVDSAGYAYVSGLALSPDFPFTVPPPVPNQPGLYFRFLTKLNPLGTGIVWSVCPNFPSSGPIALDGSGSIYVLGTGVDSSTVTKLTPNGDKILYSVTIPHAAASAMAVDPGGNVYLTGEASAGLATTPAAYQTTCSSSSTPCSDSFVLKLNRTAAVEYATYMRSPSQSPRAIAVDSQGAAWITGVRSPVPIPPVTWVDGAPGAFVSKFDAAGAKLLYATGFGGGRNLAETGGLGVAVDSQGAAYVVGSGAGVPTTPGSLQPGLKSFFTRTGFVVKYAPTGEIVYGTYVGDSGLISAVAVDALGNAYFGVNASYIVLSPDGSRILASARPFPSSNSLIALDGKGGVYIAGGTSTTVFLTTPGAFQTQYSGGGDNAFVAKFDLTRPAGPDLTSVVNAASLRVGLGTSSGAPDGSVAAGEIVTLFGHGFSPGPGLRVTFNGYPASLLYSDAGQINAVVPFEVGVGGSTFLSIETGGQTIWPVKLPVAPAQPGVFTVDGSGRGQAAALNQDGSVNSSTNPALRGSIVSVFMSGVGMYQGGFVIPDGSLGPLQPPFPVPVLGVGAAVDAKAAQVLFAGQAPGLIAGAVQVNLRVPDDAKSGMASLVVYAGNYASWNGPQLAIR
jgi:uncharacterized protein (TIGR03437 family)